MMTDPRTPSNDQRFDLETWLQCHAIYDPSDVHPAPMRDVLDCHTFDPLSDGLQARVFRVRNEPWVVKEGRWDMDFHLFKNVKVAMPAALTETVWKQFSQTFLPTEEEIGRQYGLYLQFAEFFGYFEPRDGHEPYVHPRLDRLVALQRDVRHTLTRKIPDLEADYGIELRGRIESILDGPFQHHNFLPKEYLLMGEPHSPQNRGRQTFYLFQEYVAGTHLHDLDLSNIDAATRDQCILFLYLLLLTHRERKLLPDTRPRYPVLQVFDWLTKTDNIILGADGLKFIDTRWFWETDSNFVKRGLFLPEVVIGQAKALLEQLIQYTP